MRSEVSRTTLREMSGLLFLVPSAKFTNTALKSAALSPRKGCFLQEQDDNAGTHTHTYAHRHSSAYTHVHRHATAQKHTQFYYR